MLDTARVASQKCNQQDTGRVAVFAPTPSGRRWFVVATKPRAERRAHAALHLKGYQPFLPEVTVRRRDRSWRTVPLFPGYVFIRLDLARPWYPIRFAPGVFQLLTINGVPAPCPDHAVEAVQSALQAAQALAGEKERWRVGSPCSLSLHPLRGVPAIVTAIHDGRAQVAVMMLGQLRQLAVRVDQLAPPGDD